MEKIYKNYDFLPDPHTAVGLKVALDFKKRKGFLDKVFVVLQTAHPAKFRDLISQNLGINVELPENLNRFMNKKEEYLVIKPEYKEFKDLLVDA